MIALAAEPGHILVSHLAFGGTCSAQETPGNTANTGEVAHRGNPFFGKSWNHRRRSKWQSRNARTDAVWKLSASLTRRPRLFELRPEVQSCQEVTAMAEGRRTLEPAGGSGGTCDETLVGISFHSFSLR